MSSASPAADTGGPSPVAGGPLYRFFLWTRLATPSLGRSGRRAAVVALIAWLPLLALSLLAGEAAGEAVRVPFLYDLQAQATLLVSLPLLLGGEAIVHDRIPVAIRQFQERQLIPAEAMPGFEAAIVDLRRLRDSLLPELILFALAFTRVGPFLRDAVALEVTTWYGRPAGSGVALSAAGVWYAYVAFPLYRFLLFRWYFRLFLWGRFLWQVSRLPLQLRPSHPDRSGGLAFLGGAALAFSTLPLAQSTTVSGFVANHLLYAGASLRSFEIDLVILLAAYLLAVLGPLCVFGPGMWHARRVGLRDYGALASSYVRQFDEKWLGARQPPGEPLVGTADLQSLADLAGSYDIVRSMRIVPFGRTEVLTLAAALLLPLLPLALTQMDLKDLVKKVVGILF